MKSWLRTHIPTAVICSAIVLVAKLHYGLEASAQQVEGLDLPFLRGMLLALVGHLADVLGGIISTGGCRVMLSVFHFWMGYPAAIAVGATLFW